MVILILKYLMLFFIPLTFSSFIICLIQRFPVIKYFKDKPGSRKVHQRIIPRIGGSILLFLFLIIIIFWKYSNIIPCNLPEKLMSTLIFILISILLIGLPDDMVIYNIQNKAKFLGEIVIAIEIVLIMGIKLNRIHFLGYDIELGWLGIPISVIWLVGVTNSINIIDGIDGLAGAIVLIGFGTIGLIATIYKNYPVLILVLILGGLISGFMIFNISPARVFLGDTGALSLGMIYGVLSIYLISDINNDLPILVTPLIVGFPVVDTFVAMGRRFSRGVINDNGLLSSFKRMSIADNEHIHHRLIYRGLTHNETVVILIVYQMIICMTAIIIIFKNKSESIVSLSILVTITIWVLYKLDYFEPIIKRIRRPSNKLRINKNRVGVIADDDVLKYSIMKYNQNNFIFNFIDQNNMHSIECNLKAIIYQTRNIIDLENLIGNAGTLYLENNCPVIIIASHNEFIIDHYRNSFDQMPIVIVSSPVYMPILFTYIDRLINHKEQDENEKQSV